MQQYRSNSYLFGGNAPVRRGVVRGLPRQPRLRARQLARLLRRAAARPGGRRQRRARRGARAGRRVVRPARQGQRLRAQGQRRPTSRSRASRSTSSQLIAAYRFLGARWADLDPLKRQERPNIPELEPAFYDLTEADHGHRCSTPATPTSASEHDDAARHRCRRCARPTAARSAPSTCTSPTRPRSAGAAAARDRSARKPSFSAEQKTPHPRAPDRRRRPRALPAHQVRRPEALLARRRRELHRRRWTS